MDTGFTATEAWVTVVVGFGSALLGAAAGFSGAVYLDYKREVKRRKATIKSLRTEIIHNIDAIHLTLTGELMELPLSDGLWRDIRVTVAHYIDDDPYDAIVAAYSLLPRVEESLRAYRSYQARKDQRDFLIKYADTTLKAVMQVLEGELKAYTPLWERVWHWIRRSPAKRALKPRRTG